MSAVCPSKRSARGSSAASAFAAAIKTSAPSVLGDSDRAPSLDLSTRSKRHFDDHRVDQRSLTLVENIGSEKHDRMPDLLGHVVVIVAESGFVGDGHTLVISQDRRVH